MTTQNQGPPGRWLPRCTLRVDPTVITLIDHIDKLVSPILDASTLGVKRYRGIDDPTSPVSLREKIDMDHVVLSFRLSRASTLLRVNETNDHNAFGSRSAGYLEYRP